MLHKSDYSSEGVPVVNPANIVNGQISIDKIMYVKKEKSLELSKYNLFLNDILLARRGDLSKCAIATSENIGWLCGTGSFVLHLCLIESYYFKLIYATQYIQSILATASVGATMDNLNQDTFSKILIPIPPLEEQKRIINGVHEWYNLIDSIDTNRKELSNAIEETKSRVLSLAISGKLVPQDPNDEPAIDLLRRINPSFTPCDTSHYENLPQGWTVASVDQLCTVIGGLWTGKKPPFVNIGVIRNTNFTKDFKLDLANTAYLDVEAKQFATRRLQQGDIILEKSGGSEKQPVGRTILFDLKEGEYSFSNFTAVLRIKDKNILLPKYLHFALVNAYLNGATRFMQKQTTGIHNLIMDKYVALTIPIPPLAEQKRIVVAIENVFQKLDKITAEL